MTQTPHRRPMEPAFYTLSHRLIFLLRDHGRPSRLCNIIAHSVASLSALLYLSSREPLHHPFHALPTWSGGDTEPRRLQRLGSLAEECWPQQQELEWCSQQQQQQHHLPEIYWRSHPH